MKIALESTDQIGELDGVPVRLWRGVTERGIECMVFVHRIGVEVAADSEQFDRELRETLPPGRWIQGVRQ